MTLCRARCVQPRVCRVAGCWAPVHSTSLPPPRAGDRPGVRHLRRGRQAGVQPGLRRPGGRAGGAVWPLRGDLRGGGGGAWHRLVAFGGRRSGGWRTAAAPVPSPSLRRLLARRARPSVTRTAGRRRGAATSGTSARTRGAAKQTTSAAFRASGAAVLLRLPLSIATTPRLSRPSRAHATTVCPGTRPAACPLCHPCATQRTGTSFLPSLEQRGAPLSLGPRLLVGCRLPLLAALAPTAPRAAPAPHYPTFVLQLTLLPLRLCSPQSSARDAATPPTCQAAPQDTGTEDTTQHRQHLLYVTNNTSRSAPRHNAQLVPRTEDCRWVVLAAVLM